MLAHPYSLVLAQHWAASLHYHRREVLGGADAGRRSADSGTAQGFPLYVAYGTYWRGWALAMQGEGEAGLA